MAILPQRWQPAAHPAKAALLFVAFGFMAACI
jgi:hypothetical protein